MNNNLYSVILYGNEKIDYLIKNINNINNIYTLTPNAKALVIDKFGKKIVDHHIIYGDKIQKNNLVKVSELQKIFFEKFKSFENNISSPSYETFFNLFNHHLSSVYFIYSTVQIIKNIENNLLIFNGKQWIKSKNKFEITNILYNYINNQRKGFIDIKINNNLITKNILKIINHFLIYLLKNKKIIWTAGFSSGLNNLKIKLNQNDNNNIFLTISNRTKYKLYISIKNLYKLIFNSKNTYDLEFILLNSKIKETYDIIFETFSKINDPLLNSINKEISKFFSSHIDYTESILEYSEKIILKSNPKLLIADQLKWFNSSVLGYIFKKNNIDTYLISHGSHVLPLNKHSKIAMNFHSRGLLYSQYANNVVLQSPSAKNLIDTINTNSRKILSQPIMWGINKGHKKKLSNKAVILHAGTIKTANSRPYLYETSSEYVQGIINLIKAIDIIPEAYLIIRFRKSMECSFENFIKLLPKSKNYEVKMKGTFIDDLSNSDLLISYSSTTIEEALYQHKPVGLYSLNSDFKYVKGSSNPPTENSRNAVYYLEQHNLVKMIKSIIKYHKIDLTANEVKQYVWKKEIKYFSNFIK
tara:strand:- start:151 stop:1905 length:1755 start_codon:yes stop_codon:yes gene_type:complete